MTRHIGSTTYKVKVVLAEDGKETIAEKILRMMRNEMLELGADCGILDLPQASRQSGRSA
ncbi:MAG: transposon-encoded TnpW family protein [Clostridiales bacterium]|nr:transposon-encoded TnpW family protein [Clostridiales bacterium]